MNDSRISDPIRAWLTDRRQVVLVTLRADGTPQSSNVVADFDGEVFRVSVTDDRAKTRNLRRDPRALLHVPGPDFGSYASVVVEAELGAVSAIAGDAAGQDLMALYDRISPEPHTDPADYLRAMVADRRLVLTLVPLSITGAGLPQE